MPNTPSSNTQFDLGRLFRWRAMLTEAQVEVSIAATRGLSLAYFTLSNEIRTGLAEIGRDDLVQECERLFPPMEDVTEVLAKANSEKWTELGLEARAIEALVKLRTLTGWVQGLIDEATFEMRMRAEAEAKAKEETRGAGFRAS